jgi:hypothetical protein
VLNGRVADRLGELIVVRCVEHGWSVDALGVVPGQARTQQVAHSCVRRLTLWSESSFVAEQTTRSIESAP